MNLNLDFVLKIIYALGIGILIGLERSMVPPLTTTCETDESTDEDKTALSEPVDTLLGVRTFTILSLGGFSAALVGTGYPSVAPIIVAGLAIWLLSWLSGQIAGNASIWTWLYIAVVVVALGYIGLVFYSWNNDLWIITNQRLVDSTSKTPINHTVSSTALINLQNISVSKRGVLASIFNFGDVLCQTASTQGQFAFRGVGDPNGVMETLDKMRDQARG